MMLSHHTAKSNPIEVSMTKPSLRNCRTCGKPFTSSKPGGYCCMACYRVAQRAGAYLGTFPARADRNQDCANCGKTVHNASVKKRRNGELCEQVFCDRDCYDQSRTKIIISRTRKCDYCGNDYQPPSSNGSSNKRFCSAECRNVGLKATPRNCVCCGVWMTPIRYVKSTGKFVSMNSGKVCSHECLIQWFKTNPVRKAKISAAFLGEKHPNWLGGRGVLDGKGGRGPGWPARAEQIRERDGHICQQCGITQEAHGRGLEVHHKIPFHDFLLWEAANEPSNLITLCKSCHTKADWAFGLKRGTRRKGKLCKIAA